MEREYDEIPIPESALEVAEQILYLAAGIESPRIAAEHNLIEYGPAGVKFWNSAAPGVVDISDFFETGAITNDRVVS